MKRRRKAFSSENLEEIWRRWKKGESISEIGRALQSKAPTIFAVLLSRGGIGPAPRRRSSRALSEAEREEVSRGLAAGMSLRGIAEQIGRAPSTVSREVRRNGGRRRYRAAAAENRARKGLRRPKHLRLATDAQLRHLVTAKLTERWSPEQIAGWLRRNNPGDPTRRISHEAIYRALYLRHRGGLDSGLLANLRTRRVLRRSRSSTTAGQTRGQIIGAVSIRKRPKSVESRTRLGHWEGDLITGSGNTHVATLVERRSRATVLVHIRSKNAATVTKSLTRALRKLPKNLRRTLTWDRGAELAKHAELTQQTGVPVFFCDPQSPWQRGTNENTNGLLRQYFPKGTRLDYSQRQLDAVAAELNRRPRKTLDYRAPADILQVPLR
jgi:IS30 family transposase